ncbi:glycosyltransferase [Ichthyenterobacterium sp. W332]|uniref:Glycosyltransferase n=1 Tax=Microcosmobacter mediterraneus TaxID=3075607 RepID=A0ABU2YNH6_9FLAO|nr:glycosyltransferase [Ichthyenterobacterium sp. W332]MDT0559382.1 glycosyltransferase [Ichthyenterobacterium sp. W332]
MKIALKILWLSPNLNHYKAKFLNYLASESELEVTVLSGSGRLGKGDVEFNQDSVFKHFSLQVLKKDFGKSKKVKLFLKKHLSEFDWVMIPAEKKNLPLFLFLLKFRNNRSNFKLFSYNHPILKSKGGRITYLDKWLTKFYFKKLDRVIFYTKQSYEWALSEKLIIKDKAFWANNTIDTLEIDKYYNYTLPSKDKLYILFIGRLIPSKRLSDLISYYQKLKESIPELSLDIIGDGPEVKIVKSALELEPNINLHGTIVDESKIAPIMKRSSLVFIPGHSGLSVNHAFAYGRPYVTLAGPRHAPEVDYIDNGKNGYILDGDFESNINLIKDLILNRDVLELFCDSAKEKGNDLSIENWVDQMKQNLLHE